MFAGLNSTIWIKYFVKLTTVQTSQKLLQLTTALKIKWTKSELDYTNRRYRWKIEMFKYKIKTTIHTLKQKKIFAILGVEGY